MTGNFFLCGVFCLFTGALMGLLYLVFRILAALLHSGKLLTAVLDVVFCVLCGGAVFLCALAVDKGRLRFFQVLFQVLGAWAAVTALSPFTKGITKAINIIFCKITRGLRKLLSFFKGLFPERKPRITKKHRKKGKKSKKQKKKT